MPPWAWPGYLVTCHLADTSDAHVRGWGVSANERAAWVIPGQWEGGSLSSVKGWRHRGERLSDAGNLMRWEMWVRWLRWLEVMWGAVSCLGGGERRVLKWTGVADITIIWSCGIEYCVSAGHMRSLIIGFLNSKSLSKKLQLCSAGWWAGQQRHSQHSAASQSGEGRGAGRIWWWWHIDNTLIHWYTTPVSHRLISEYRGSCLQWGSSENVSVSGPWCW